MDGRDRPLKIREAADELGVDYGTIRGAIEKGTLPAERVDDSFRIRRDDLAAFGRQLFARPTPARQARPEVPSLPAEGQDEARAFTEQARRWVKRATPPPTPRKRKPGPEAD